MATSGRKTGSINKIGDARNPQRHHLPVSTKRGRSNRRLRVIVISRLDISFGEGRPAHLIYNTSAHVLPMISHEDVPGPSSYLHPIQMQQESRVCIVVCLTMHAHNSPLQRTCASTTQHSTQQVVYTCTLRCNSRTRTRVHPIFIVQDGEDHLKAVTLARQLLCICECHPSEETRRCGLTYM